MPDLKELLAPIKTYMGDDEDKKTEVADQLHADLPAVAQVLIDKGAGLGKGEVKKQLSTAKADLKKALERVEELEGELDEARNKSPEEVQRLSKEVEKLKGQVAEASGKLTDEQNGRKQDKLAIAVEQLIGKLQPGKLVVPAAVKAIKAEYADRIQLADDGTLEVRQLGSDAVYAPAKGKEALDLLAADVLKVLPAEWRLAGVEGGGGRGSGGGGGGEGEVSRGELVEQKAGSGNYSDL